MFAGKNRTAVVAALIAFVCEKARSLIALERLSQSSDRRKPQFRIDLRLGAALQICQAYIRIFLREQSESKFIMRHIILKLSFLETSET